MQDKNQKPPVFRSLARCLSWRVLFCLCTSGCVPLCGGLCVPSAPGPSSGAGEPYPKAAGGSVGRVTCGFLQPTTETTGVYGHRQDVWALVLLE